MRDRPPRLLPGRRLGNTRRTPTAGQLNAPRGPADQVEDGKAGRTMPGIQPPSLLCEELVDGRLLVRYWSPRQGLAELADLFEVSRQTVYRGPGTRSSQERYGRDMTGNGLRLPSTATRPDPGSGASPWPVRST